jgi:hypothetical protein
VPYIIETWRWEGSGAREKQTVTTLEEARESVESIIRHLHAYASEDHPDYRPMIPDTLPASGGTIGPLPDGTVIEVHRVN